MRNSEEFFRLPSVQEFMRMIRTEFANAKRPADQVIMDESDFIRTLKISKRQAAKIRAEGGITFSKVGAKIYYKYSDVLEYVERFEVKSIYSNNRILNSK